MTDGRTFIRSRNLLYTDDVGRDACGIGGIAARGGKPSSEVVKKAVLALTAMEHRGGVCANSGDGAGIVFQLPQPFFKERAKALGLDGARYLKPEDRLAVGVLFLHERDVARRDRALALVRDALAGGPIEWLGLRDVPVNDGVLPPTALASKPHIVHLLFRVADPSKNADDVEKILYARRLTLRHRLAEAGLGAYLPSLSARLISYKGLLTSPQLGAFYADLSDPSFETGLATFHRRYSTNTYPNWDLAQPFRFACHNGEINTVATNREAVHAYACGLNPPVPGVEILTPKMSDSGSLDEWVEHLVLEKRWSLLRAIRLAIPPVWESEADIWGQDAVDVFTYYRRALGGLGAWDGPAGIIATDGTTLVGLVDRMGLRPVRWFSDNRGWLYIASESGVFGLDNAAIVASGQLQPGQMIAMDTRTGERMDSHRIMAEIVAETRDELGTSIHDLNRAQILLPETFDFNSAMADKIENVLGGRDWSVDHLLQGHGWDFDRAVFVKKMAKLRKEPLSSMGFDRVLTVFSMEHQTLFKYLQQTFAEVTNPPIDPYREGGAMSLTSYLGRSPFVPSAEGLPCRQMELTGPVLSDAMVSEIFRGEVLAPERISAVFPLNGGEQALRSALHRVCSEAEALVNRGHVVLMLTDLEAFTDGFAPIPSLLALGAVSHYLSRQGLRNKCSLVVQAGDVQEGHDIACLVAFGADAVHPYLMLHLVRDGLTFTEDDTKQEWSMTARECLDGLVAALEDSFKKIISKMGITTIEGYRGARLFEAVGFGKTVMDFLGDFPSRIGGVELADLVEDAKWRLAKAEKMTNGVLGRNRDYLAFNSKVRMALRKAAQSGSASMPLVDDEPAKPDDRGDEGGEAAYATPGGAMTKEYRTFSKLVNDRVPTVLRDLFDVVLAADPMPLDRVQSARDLVANHYRGAAMSHGALTKQSHQDIAAALNELGGLSNSGEGGEARYRNDLPERYYGPQWDAVVAERLADPEEFVLGGDLRKSRLRSKIRQVASGRFGVDAEYLANADEIQIKMAQGAKPGEGGQLMGKKVTKEIAEIRYGKPGNDLISPPPHHDIYSIEDLAQLIYDLKALRPGVPVSVKLVAVNNIGTIAVGVAKAGADIIEIDGIGGGTGAAMFSSKEHCGLPSELGLAEAHQALTINGLRKSVVLRVGGGIKNGTDVIKYALFGAEEFVLGQALMVSVGCIVCKSCHVPNCPTGITGTQGEYKGSAEHTKAYLLGLGEETRSILSQMGFAHVRDIVGRTDLLRRRKGLPGNADKVDVSKFLHDDMALSRLPSETFPQFSADGGVCTAGEPSSLNRRILDAALDAIETAQNADLVFRIRNHDRSAGATIAGKIARLYGREGLPNMKRVRVRLEGEAGQSLGAWCVNGLDIELKGFAQDGVAKGMSGGTVVVTLDYGRVDYGPESQSVAGNNVGFGATGGTIFIGGRAGHRLGIRNSGATIVAEAAGKYACEYQTRGRVVILGAIENEIGSGMTGGELIVFDPRNEVPAKIHSRSVAVVDCTHVDYEWLHPVIIAYHTRTGSKPAEAILKNWQEIRRWRRLRKVVPLGVAQRAEEYKVAGTNAG